MTMNNRFQRGTGRFTCANCGKRTRVTGPDHAASGLCERCYQMSGDDNDVADGNMTEDQFFSKWNEHSTWFVSK